MIRRDSWQHGQRAASRLEKKALRMPKPFNFRSDPFERGATGSNNYACWWIERVSFALPPIYEIVDGFKWKTG